MLSRKPAGERPGRRGSSASRGYGHRWRLARAGYLRLHPLCRPCARAGRARAAAVVDHVRPHRGDRALFWDPANWQPLCRPCHDSRKQREERRGYAAGPGPDGWPADPRHPANRQGGRGGENPARPPRDRIRAKKIAKA